MLFFSLHLQTNHNQLDQPTFKSSNPKMFCIDLAIVGTNVNEDPTEMLSIGEKTADLISMFLKGFSSFYTCHAMQKVPRST